MVGTGGESFVSHLRLGRLRAAGLADLFPGLLDFSGLWRAWGGVPFVPFVSPIPMGCENVVPCPGDEAYDANVMHFWRGAGDGVRTPPT